MKDYLGKKINANLIDGIKTLTGKIEFQKEGLLFKVDSVNGIMRMPVILYSDIISIEPKNTLRIIPNGLYINTKDDKHFFFVVTDRKNVMAFIQKQTKEFKS